MKHIQIYYASTSGNTYIVISHLFDIFKQMGHHVECFSVLHTHIIGSADAYIFACGTYGHGLLQEHMEKFLYIHNKNTLLAGNPCGVVGLGDNAYDTEYNIESAALLHDFVIHHGGKISVEALKINKSPLPHLNKSVKIWGQKFSSSIESGKDIV